MDLRDITLRIEAYVNERVIEELEMILDRTQLAVEVKGVRSHITFQITRLKQ